MTIHHAIYLPLFEPFGHPRIIAELAHDAEQAGWDGVFTWDDIAGWKQDMADPTVALAAAALVTQRVRQAHLRTMVTAVQALRGAAAEGPFDVVVSGETPTGRQAQTEEHIAAFAAAGATWWLESLNPERRDGQQWSLAQIRERVLAGPLGSN